MELPFLMDTMFDLLNESDNLDISDLQEIESEGKFFVTAGDGTRIAIQCRIEK